MSKESIAVIRVLQEENAELIKKNQELVEVLKEIQPKNWEAFPLWTDTYQLGKKIENLIK